MANTFNFVGKISIPKDTDKFKAYSEETIKDIWIKHTLNLTATCGDNRHNLKIQCFGDKDLSKRSFYTVLNKDTNGQYASVRIMFNERFDKVKNVAPFRRFVIDTGDADERANLYSMSNRYKNDGLTEEEKEKYNIHSDKDIETLIEKSYSQRKEFIYEYDFINELYKIFSTDEFKDVKFKISGNYQFTKSINEKGEIKYYADYIPTRIVRAKVDEECKSEMSAEIIFKDSNDIQTTENIDGVKNTVFNGWLVNYNKNYKKDDATSEEYISMPISINMNSLSDKGIERIKDKFEPMTVTSEYKVIGMVLNCIDGSPTLSFTEDMLTEDEKADIECGFYTFEDLKKEKGSIKGERIKEFKYSKFATGYSSGAKDTTYDSSLFGENKSDSDDNIFNFDDIDLDNIEIL